jgi:hypothetical protein
MRSGLFNEISASPDAMQPAGAENKLHPRDLAVNSSGSLLLFGRDCRQIHDFMRRTEMRQHLFLWKRRSGRAATGFIFDEIACKNRLMPDDICPGKYAAA